MGGHNGYEEFPLCHDAKNRRYRTSLLDQLLAGGAASAAFEQGGLLDSLKKALTERALNAEMDHHLAGDDGVGNTRNGYGWKTVMTDTGKLAIDVPRDRQASFDPQLIAKYQRRFPGLRRQDRVDVCARHEHPRDRRGISTTCMASTYRLT